MENVDNFHTGDQDRRDMQDASRKEKVNNEEGPMVKRHRHHSESSEPRHHSGSSRHRHHSRSARGKCRCKSRRRKRKLRLSHNPFIIFYLEMYAQNPCRRVVDVAREAGKKWCALPQAEKEKYIRLARKLQCRKR